MKFKYLNSESIVMLLCVLLLVNSKTLPAQNPSLVVTGMVTDNAGKGLQAVMVLLKGTAVSAVTNQDGAFNIAGIKGTDITRVFLCWLSNAGS